MLNRQVSKYGSVWMAGSDEGMGGEGRAKK